MTTFAPSRQAMDLFMKACPHHAGDRPPTLTWDDPKNTCATCVEAELTRTYHLGYLAAIEEAARLLDGGYRGSATIEHAVKAIRSLAVPLPEAT
jgi:hypothetical protein